MNMRSPLSKARGLGSAKSGTGHWWLQRVSAVLLIPLSYWLVTLMRLCQHAPYEQTVVWLKSPVNSTAISAWVMVAFYHAAMGLQVVIEDYVSHEGRKIILIWLVNAVFFMLALSAVLSIIRILLAG
ncbi:MAG: succinate dehydrogenase, hydrophobic membrane anchor protein [Methylobacter sp.]|nr:MAG: succinate dehydrogenase, hydrophobic membrane anchor protein [Methylobacter sp.]